MPTPGRAVHLVVSCAAAPEIVYDLLADLRSHLEWGGTRQRSDFRLLSLEAPPGTARAGSEFTSRGTIPMSGRRWADSSTVIVAERPTAFAFETQSVAGTSRPMRARWRSRYDIQLAATGCLITYTQVLLEVSRPLLRLSLPVVRELTWRVAIPMFCGRGLRNLVRMAEERRALVTSGR